MGLFRTPTGDIVTVPDDQAGSATANGYTPVSEGEAGATTGAITPEDRGVSGVIGAGASSTLSGLTLGLSDVGLRGILTKAQADRIASDRAQHETLSMGGQVLGSLAPAILSGGAATPAGLTSSLGRSIVKHATGEGAGVLARAGAEALGAGAEGALYGGGNYLSSVALEDKPLSAEGFIGGMGHGALFAAPVGGALSLAGSALIRARALFPRSEVTQAAASGIKQEATSTLAQSVADGETMAAAAERKLQDIEANVGNAQAGETVTRRMFGGADPQAMGDQVTGAVDRQQVAQALQKYEASKAQLSEWIAGEADPDLERVLTGLQPEHVQSSGVGGVPIGEFGAPGAGGFKSSEELAQAAQDAGVESSTGSTAESTRALKRPGVLADGTPSTSHFDLADSGLTFDPAKRAYRDPSGKAMASTPVGEMNVGLAPRATPEGPSIVHAGPMGDEAFGAYRDSFVKGLSEDERQAALDYSSGSHKGINKALREGGEMSEANTKRAAALDGVVARSSAPSDIRVLRGMPDTDGLQARMAGMRPGDVLSDPGFVSTTALGEIPREFNNDVVMEISVPKGSPAAPIPATKAAEQELLLPRGQRFRVDEVREQQNPMAKKRQQVVMRVTVIPEAAASAPVTDTLTGPRASGLAGGEAVRFGRPSQRMMEIRESGMSPRQVKADEARDWAEAQMPPGFKTGALETHRDFSIEHSLPIDYGAVKENSVYVTKPSALAEHGIQGNEIHPEHAARMAEAREGGIKLNPIDIDVMKDGRWFVEDGNHRLQQAAATDAPIAARFRQRGEGWEPQKGARDISKRIRDVLPRPAISKPATDTLTGLLRGTQEKLSAGQGIGEIGAPARAEYAAAKAVKTSEAAEHFRAKANAKNYAGSEMGAAERAANDGAANPFYEPASGIGSSEDLDKFFRDLSAPKTRDSYVAANIGRAMREEGSHAAALVRVEREWSEHAAAEVWAERAATLEYEGGYSRAEAERIASSEAENAPNGTIHGAESARPNQKRVEAARKAAAASVERRRELHSAVASNLPHDLQSTWDKEGYKFLQEEAARIRGVKDPINAASKISESFTEKYGSASETSRGYEGDRFHRRAEIEAKYAESWANEQERKHYASMMRDEPPPQSEPSPTRTQPVAESSMIAQRTGVKRATINNIDDLGKFLGIDLSAEPAESVGKTIVKHGMKDEMRGVVEDRGIAAAIAKHNGKGVDIGPQLARAAKAIGDHEDALAGLVDALGPEAPVTAVTNAKAYRAALAAQSDASAASSAKAGASITNKVQPGMAGAAPGSATVVDDAVSKALKLHDAKLAARAGAAPGAGGGVVGKAADVGTALEVLKAMGVHVPGVAAIPVIGPILSLWFKTRAVMGILGRKGGSIGKSTEGLVASTAAATRDRMVAATSALLEAGGRGASKAASYSAGTAALLGQKLFPGGEDPKSKDPQVLYHARMDEIARAQAPNAIDHAIGDRYQTSDPALHDALVAQVQKGIAFLDSKAPKETVLPGMLPGDGTWKPGKAQLDVFARYVHAVNDPASVLEDLAKGHVTIEGAETLRVVYPEMFAEAQRTLLEAAPKMRATLPYTRRVAISIMFQVPIDGTMTPQHAQFLMGASTPHGPPAGPPQGPPTGAPSITGPLRLGPQTMPTIDHRAGA